MYEPVITQTVFDIKLINYKRFFNLRNICLNSSDVIYDTCSNPNLRFRLKNINTTIIFSSSGFGRVFGTRNESECKSAILLLRKKLQHCGYRTRLVSMKIHTITAKLDIKQPINSILTSSEGLLCKNSEKFSGLTVYINKITAVIFHTGKINFFGAKNFDQIRCSADYLLKHFKNKNSIK